VLRLPMVYGPGDYLHRLFPYLKRMDDGRPAILLEQGQGEWRWTRGYVENVAASVALAVVDERAAGRIYNVGERDALSEVQWLRAVAQTVGWQGDVVAVPKDQLPRPLRLDLAWEHHLVMDTSRIRGELGYEEVVCREEALVRTVGWERAHPPALDAAVFDYAAEDAVLKRV